MKRIISILMFLVPVAALFAADEVIPAEFMSKDMRDWQLNLTTLYVLATVAGRVFSALKAGGGLVGVFRGILYGENVPKPIAKDYAEELKPKPPVSTS